MKQVSVTELKNQLSRYLRLVKQGVTVEVLERSVPIARLEALRDPGRRGSADLEGLVRDGIVARAARKPRSGRLPPPVRARGDAVRALIEERGER
jgi:antitoxin (DNA-binding transcriptional repressor) of toxin-antitoxin stability system